VDEHVENWVVYEVLTPDEREPIQISVNLQHPQLFNFGGLVLQIAQKMIIDAL